MSAERHRWLACAFGASLLAILPVAAEEPLRPTSFREADCRYLTRYVPQAVPDSGPVGTLWFPDDDIAQAGFELRGLRWRWRSALCTAVFGADLQSFEAREWDVTTSVVGGIELANPAATNRFRVLLAYLTGSVPFGQFFTTEKVESYGLQLQFDF